MIKITVRRAMLMFIVIMVILTSIVMFLPSESDKFITAQLKETFTVEVSIPTNKEFERNRHEVVDWEEYAKYEFSGIIENIELNPILTQNEIAINTKIYEVASVYYNEDTLKSIPPEFSDPLMLMAMTNIESGLWIGDNFGKIYCSAIPIRVIDNPTAETVVNWGVRETLESDKYWKIITPYWQHQGPMQMSDGYGISVAIKRDDLRGTEKDRTNLRLSTRYPNMDPSNFTYPSNSGDRFNWVDAVNRTAGKWDSNWKQYLNSKVITKTGDYAIDNKYAFLSLISISHNTGISATVNADSVKAGKYREAGYIRLYSKALSNPDIIAKIDKEIKTNLKAYREGKINLRMHPSDAFMSEIVDQILDTKVIPANFYDDSGKYGNTYLYYPIKVLYNYMLLTSLYSGG